MDPDYARSAPRLLRPWFLKDVYSLAAEPSLYLVGHRGACEEQRVYAIKMDHTRIGYLGALEVQRTHMTKIDHARVSHPGVTEDQILTARRWIMPMSVTRV